MTVCPRLTCPSPAITTLPRWRTQRIVVPCIPDSLRSGVGAIVGLHQMIEVHVCVALSRGEARVAEKLLDCAEIRSLVEEMRGERVAKRMRARGDRGAGTGDVARDEAGHTPRAEAPATAIDEDRRPLDPFSGELAPVRAQRIERDLADRHDA